MHVFIVDKNTLRHIIAETRIEKFLHIKAIFLRLLIIIQ